MSKKEFAAREHTMNIVRKQLLYRVFALALLLTIGQVSCAPVRDRDLKSTEPESVGLTWRECAISQGFDWRQAEDCFGHPMPLWGKVEEGTFGHRVGLENIQLTIGQDAYEASLNGGIVGKEKYTLYRNGKAIRSLYGEFSTYSPNISLQNIGGKAVWEFSDGRTATVVCDDLDIRQVYSVDKAYRPYGLGERLILVGEKDGKYFVIYDGWKVGPDFEEVVIAYCCEPVMWSVQHGQGKYLFWGSRDGQWYVVEIALREA
jgi:hypothetical protein